MKQRERLHGTHGGASRLAVAAGALFLAGLLLCGAEATRGRGPLFQLARWVGLEHWIHAAQPALAELAREDQLPALAQTLPTDVRQAVPREVPREAPLSVAVNVRDSSGLPLAGARVGLAEGSDFHERARTDDQGACELSLERHDASLRAHFGGDTVVIAAELEGYLPGDAYYLVFQPGVRVQLDLTLEFGVHVVRGEVRLEGDDSDEDVSVVVGEAGAPLPVGTGVWRASRARRTPVASDRSYEISLPEGGADVLFQGKNLMSQRVHVALSGLARQGPLVRLSEGRPVVGRVRGERGQPIAGARVWVDASCGQGQREVRAGAEGEFNLQGLRPGRVRLWAQGPMRDDPYESVLLEVAEDGSTTWNPMLFSKPAVRVQVGGSMESRLEGLLVHYQAPLFGAYDVTDAQGLSPARSYLPADFDVQLFDRRRSSMPLAAELGLMRETGTELQTVRLKLPADELRLGGARGRISDIRRRDLPASLELWFESVTHEYPRSFPFDMKSGEFEVSDLPAGRYRVTLVLLGRKAPTRLEFDLHAGAIFDLGEVPVPVTGQVFLSGAENVIHWRIVHAEFGDSCLFERTGSVPEELRLLPGNYRFEFETATGAMRAVPFGVLPNVALRLDLF